MVGSCQACNMRFASLDEMREHYTTDFHVANVRARVEGQAKMSAAEFKRRTMADDEKKPIFNCKLCKKQFHSVQTLQSHVKSTEHLMRKEQRIIERDSTAGSALSSTSLGSAALGLHRRHRAHVRARAKVKEAEADRTLTEAELEEQLETTRKALASGNVAGASTARTALKKKLRELEGCTAVVEKPKVSFGDREADVTETRCLFSGHVSKTMRGNLKHMLTHYQFRIPLEERVIDMRALLQYLARKVNGLMCLVCGDATKRFESLEALRDHMAAAGHQRIVLTSEYAEFYEGALDDGEPAEISRRTEDGEGALVVRGDKQRTVVRRDMVQARGMVRRLRENNTQINARRMIASSGAKETQLLLKERRQETQVERTKHFKLVNFHHRYQKLHLMRVGIKKLWKKGYDGDGEMA